MDALSRAVQKLPGVVRRSIARGQHVGVHREAGPLHIVVEHGALAVAVWRADGRMLITEVLGPDTCTVSETVPVTDEEEHRGTFALVPTVLLELPFASWHELLVTDAELAAATAAAKARQHDALRQRLAILGIRSAMGRVAASVLYLSDQIGQTCPLASGRYLDVTQDVIAATAGIARPIANRELLRLRAGRLVHLERSLVCVLTPAELRRIVNGATSPRHGAGRTTCRLRHPSLPLRCVPGALPAGAS